MERIQKILAHGGISSRRASEALIKAGRVRVNGRVITELGTKADARRDKIEVDGKRVVAEDHVYLVLHKPRGVVATMSDPEGRPTVREMLGEIAERVYPVGRLDFATSGVLLATNDGELADGLLHPRKTVPKTYVLKVKGVMKPEDLEVWKKGIKLEDGMTLPAGAKLIRHEGDKTWFELTIKEGRNQQIRRMGEATGFPVMRLARVAFADVSAEGLAPGRWRHMTRDELQQLKKTYGVPRSIPAMSPVVAAEKRGARTIASARRDPDAEAPRGERSASTRVASAHGPSARGERGAGTRSTGTGPSPRASGPGRRSTVTTEDWGSNRSRPTGRTRPAAAAPSKESAAPPRGKGRRPTRP